MKNSTTLICVSLAWQLLGLAFVIMGSRTTLPLVMLGAGMVAYVGANIIRAMEGLTDTIKDRSNDPT